MARDPAMVQSQRAPSVSCGLRDRFADPFLAISTRRLEGSRHYGVRRSDKFLKFRAHYMPYCCSGTKLICLRLTA